MTIFNQTNPKWCVIAESDPFLAQLLHRFAEKYDLQIQHARTGEDVIELVNQYAPVLIILELEIPGKMRGWDVSQALIKDPQKSAIPVILCSWLNRKEALALAGQATAYLQLPGFSFEEFVEAVELTGVINLR